MARQLFTGTIIFYALTSAAPLFAEHTGDMFQDQGIAIQNRPSVPSDQYEGIRSHPDFFPTRQPYMRTDKDMFDSVPVTGDPGIEQHFSAHMHPPSTEGSLFQDPNRSR